MLETLQDEYSLAESMNTKIVMTASAIALGIAGIALTFIPDEILSYLRVEKTLAGMLFLQISGALLFGFAMLNWMLRTAIIGGIYNKPVALANFTHFAIGALALVKGVAAAKEVPLVFWGLTLVYSLFAIAFGLKNFRNPSRVN